MADGLDDINTFFFCCGEIFVVSFFPHFCFPFCEIWFWHIFVLSMGKIGIQIAVFSIDMRVLFHGNENIRLRFLQFWECIGTEWNFIFKTGEFVANRFVSRTVWTKPRGKLDNAVNNRRLLIGTEFCFMTTFLSKMWTIFHTFSKL